MAASVLGKRSRRISEQDIELLAPPKRQATRRSAPQIYEDAPAPETYQKVTRAKRSVSTRNARTKHTVPNQAVKHLVATSGEFSPTPLDAAKENVPPLSFSTPTAVRFKDAFARDTPNTPKQRVRLAGKLLTPRSNRGTTTPRAQNVYTAARQLFTQASNPSRLVGRQEERTKLAVFISESIQARRGGCTYVSGPPGTGKSALVQEIFHEFRDQASLQVSVVNCVAFKSSAEVLGKLADDFGIPHSSNRKITMASLSKTFTTTKNRSFLLLLDEIDSLLDGDCEILYQIFEWALHRSSSLILVGIANALDLTDRFLPRLKMRNLKPQLLPFLPYSATQISSIVTEKLRSLLPAGHTSPTDFVPFVHPSAIQLCGKKIASQTGDLRKAFSLIRRAIDRVEQDTLQKFTAEQAETPTKKPLGELSNLAEGLPATTTHLSPLKPFILEVHQRSALSRLTAETAPRANIAHVAKLAASIFNNSTVSRLHGLNLQQKAVLCALVANETRRNERDPYKTPSKSSGRIPTVKDLFGKYAMLCKRDDGLLHPLKSTEFRDVVASLETLGLLHESTGRNSGILTPSSTPSRAGKSTDDKLVVSAVSETEMRQSLNGPGGDLLQRLFDE